MKKYTLALTLALSLSAPVLAQGALPRLTMGVVPQYPTVTLYTAWQPVVEHLSKTCQVHIELVLIPSIPRFEQAFKQGQFDLVYLNPYHMVMAHKAQGYVPIVRDHKNALTGILVVHRSSSIQSIDDLKNQRIAFPAPNAFGASLYMRALLNRTYHLSFDTYYARTHSNAYRSVLSRESTAAGGIAATLDKETTEVKQNLRIIYETPSTASHPLAMHPRLSPPLKQCLVQTLLAPPDQGLSAEQWQAIQMPEPIKANYSKDYQPLERLNLDEFVVDEP